MVPTELSTLSAGSAGKERFQIKKTMLHFFLSFFFLLKREKKRRGAGEREGGGLFYCTCANVLFDYGHTCSLFKKSSTKEKVRLLSIKINQHKTAKERMGEETRRWPAQDVVMPLKTATDSR